MVKKKKRDNSQWMEITIKRETVKELKLIQVKNDLRNYDQLIKYLISNLK